MNRRFVQESVSRRYGLGGGAGGRAGVGLHVLCESHVQSVAQNQQVPALFRWYLSRCVWKG